MLPAEETVVSSPDLHGAGLVNAPLDPLRYDGQTDDPHEVRRIFWGAASRTSAHPSDEMLRVARGGLNPGGCILASVPNAAHWSLRLKLLFGRFEYTETGLCDATHLRWFTSRSIQALFRSVGFNIVAVRYGAGTALPVYTSRWFARVPRRLLTRAIKMCTAAVPSLAACQVIVKAEAA